MKTTVKTTKKTKKWHDHDYFVRKHPHSDAWINLMVFCRTLFMMRGLDKIVDDAVAYANDWGENVKKKSFPSHTAEGKLRQILRNTEKALKKKKGVPVMKEWGHYGPTIRLPKSGGGGCASPDYGMTVRGARNCIGVAIHEMAHIIHLVKVNEYRQNGKRRPHDICYNRIMLMVAKKLFKLTDDEMTTHPVDAGYGVGRGYAPTHKTMYPAINKLIKDEDPRIMRFFTAERPAEKKTREPNRNLWLIHLDKWTNHQLDAYFPERLSDGIYDMEINGEMQYELQYPIGWEELRDKIKAGEKLDEIELHMIDNYVDEYDYWHDCIERYPKAVANGYLWWMENVQNAGGGV